MTRHARRLRRNHLKRALRMRMRWDDLRASLVMVEATWRAAA